MANTGKQAVAAHRRRLKQRGLVRIEVRAPREDAPLLRDIAGALADPSQGAQTRALLRERFAPHPVKGLKALLVSAPLDLELNFDRSYDGREIEF